jgi:hypothetical protein
MKPTATVALPTSAPEAVLAYVQSEVEASYEHVDITYELRDDISHPIATSFARNGTDLGGIDGDRDAPSIAVITGIHLAANKAFRAAPND